MPPAPLATGPAAPNTTLTSAFALTTTFTAPSQCAQSVGGLTMLQNDGFRIWLNAPLPVPGTTIMSCYPSEFASSFLLQTGGVSQAAFSPLVCPQGYTTQGPFTSNYIACCPSGWDGFAPAANAPSDRPAFGGTCFTNIFNNPIQITSYDVSAVKASSIFTATGTADQAFAYPYEGFALGVAVLASTVPTVVGSTPSTSSAVRSTSSTSTTPSSTAGASNDPLLSNTTVLAGVIVGCVIAVLLFAALILLALNYRKKRMLPSAGSSEGNNYPDYAAHIRLNDDSPTPMVYLSQPPEVVTEWNSERRDKGIDFLDVDKYEVREPEVAELPDSHELQDDFAVTGDEEMVKEVEWVELEYQDAVGETKKIAQSVYELDAAVDAMMEEMVGMMKSKRLPQLPPKSPAPSSEPTLPTSPLDQA